MTVLVPNLSPPAVAVLEQLMTPKRVVFRKGTTAFDDRTVYMSWVLFQSLKSRKLLKKVASKEGTKWKTHLPGPAR